jgi:hypothetical protein
MNTFKLIINENYIENLDEFAKTFHNFENLKSFEIEMNKN